MKDEPNVASEMQRRLYVDVCVREPAFGRRFIYFDLVRSGENAESIASSETQRQQSINNRNIWKSQRFRYSYVM